VTRVDDHAILHVRKSMFRVFRTHCTCCKSNRFLAHIAVLSAATASAFAATYSATWGPAPPVPQHGMQPLPSGRVVEPLIFPVLGWSHWKDDYRTNRGGFLHAAIDIAAPKMSPIVAPFSGIIGFKTESFWIYGDDGWAMLGTHLNNDDVGTHDRRGCKDVMFAPNLRPGQHVYAGQFIGYVGMSGNATGPHLHFELYAPGNGPTAPRVRNPFPSLKASQVIQNPRIALNGPKPKKGDVRFDACIRRVNPHQGWMTVILVAKQTENGRSQQVFGPHYVRLRVSDSVVRDSGGWKAIESLEDTATISCYMSGASKPENAVVDRLILPPLTWPNTRKRYHRRHLNLVRL